MDGVGVSDKFNGYQPPSHDEKNASKQNTTNAPNSSSSADQSAPTDRISKLKTGPNPGLFSSHLKFTGAAEPHMKTIDTKAHRSIQLDNIRKATAEPLPFNRQTAAHQLRNAKPEDIPRLLWDKQPTQAKLEDKNDFDRFNADSLQFCSGAAAAIGNYFGADIDTGDGFNREVNDIVKVNSLLDKISETTGNQLFSINLNSRSPLSHYFTIVRVDDQYDLYESDANDESHLVHIAGYNNHSRGANAVGLDINGLENALNKMFERMPNARPAFDMQCKDLPAERMPDNDAARCLPMCSIM